MFDANTGNIFARRCVISGLQMPEDWLQNYLINTI